MRTRCLEENFLCSSKFRFILLKQYAWLSFSTQREYLEANFYSLKTIVMQSSILIDMICVLQLKSGCPCIGVTTNDSHLFKSNYWLVIYDDKRNRICKISLLWCCLGSEPSTWKYLNYQSSCHSVETGKRMKRAQFLTEAEQITDKISRECFT